VGGKAGNFTVDVLTRPRYVDMTRCIACGACAEKCPKKVEDEYNAGLSTRKAAYVRYAQAVPLKYAIDPVHCIYFQKGKCRACEKLCPAQAIDFKQSEQRRSIRTGSIILAPGSDLFDPATLEAYGYKRFPNVVTGMEFERILSATGPFQGHLRRPSDHKAPRSIAWIQCVGSRDPHRARNPYCSSICCMYAVKEAVVAKEHAGPDLDATIFYMDMRTHGKDFERYYESAREKHGVRFIRNRVETVNPVAGKDDLTLAYVNEKGQRTEEEFHMVVLSVGLQTGPETLKLAECLGVDLTEGGFCKTDSFRPVRSSRKGIYVCGPFQGPKDIPQSVIEAGAAACAATQDLAPVRHSRTKSFLRPLEKEVGGEAPRIGVFVCHCGANIGGVVNVPEVSAYARTLPGVAYVEENLFTCAQDTQEKMRDIIKTQRLNRIVVAACTPRTHESLFQETLIRAGLNKYLLEMANIRNQDSWVHGGDPEGATQKAKDLVRMAVAKASLIAPLMEQEVAMKQKALVVGGGLSGMVAARSLAAHGYPVVLVEKTASLGGQARSLFKTWQGEDIQRNLEDLIQSVESDPMIEVHVETRLDKVDGFVGNFTSVLKAGDREITVDHGIAILATGAREFKPNEYLHGKDPRVVTHLELDKRFIKSDPSLAGLSAAAFIQCVGSREPGRPYCSRVCCTHTMVSALHLKELNPDMKVYVLYRDIRTYGERESLYQKARERGVVFIRFQLDGKPRVQAEKEGLQIRVLDPILERSLLLDVDLLVLASAIVPDRDEALARLFKVPVSEDGFFVEAHAKLAPSEFATDGLFLCGMAHYPKPVDESIAQALAAASRALTLLSRENIQISGVTSRIVPEKCSGCLGCLQVCPYGAIRLDEKVSLPAVNEALCKGCGACAAACPSEAVLLMGFNHRQLYAQIHAAFGVSSI
jgi:heterodisulfide reductase subunit A2